MVRAEPQGAAKVFTAGTHRARAPEQTWDLVVPLLPDFGITRVSDVTGLDVLGIPVAMATRPLAKTLSVSQGKGQTYLLAKVSAAMEGIEFWHCEHIRPPFRYTGVSADKLGLSYSVDDVATMAGSLVSDRTPLDWIEATGLCSGTAELVPADLARLCHPGEVVRRRHGLMQSSNGLASGNSRSEAALHALYELMERDALGLALTAADRVVVDPNSIPEEAGAQLVQRIRHAGAHLDLIRINNRFGVPTFAARIWSAEFPLSCLGYGAHLSAEVAASRAVTEAAQTRVTSIAGSRDDLIDHYGHIGRGVPAAPPAIPLDRLAHAGPLPWQEAVADTTPSFGTFDEELAWAAATAAQVTSHEPLLVDLSTVPEFAVVKVVLPGAGFDRQMVHPGRSSTAQERLFGAR